MGGGFGERRKEEADVRLRIPAKLGRRLEAFADSNDKGVETRNEAATYLLAFALDELDARARRKEAWDAWVAAGRKGLPPPAP